MGRRRPLAGQSPNQDPDRDDNESESDEEEETEEEEEDIDTEEVQVATSFQARVSRPEPTVPCPATGEVGEDNEGGGGWNREEMEGLFCPVCLEAWFSGGNQCPSCLPCGHLCGLSCIKKWFRQHRCGGECPQCNAKCSMKDVWRIYGSRVLVTDDELQKRIQTFEARCDSLEKKDADWRKKEVEWLRKEV